MKKNEGNRRLYKIIVALTLAAPMAIYLFLSATLFNIDYDYRLENVTSEDIILIEDFTYTDNTDAVYNGTFSILDGEYGFYIDDTTIIRLDDGYFMLEEGVLVDIEALAIQKETGYRLPMAFVITALGIGVVFLVIQRKMEWYKLYPRVSALIALVTGTLVLLVINTIVSNLFNVFLVATMSWALYCLEYFVNQNFITEEEGKKSESDLLNSLKKALGDK
jgi:hypothetical protein